MATEFNFGSEMSDYGREILRELILTDYGSGCSFDSINVHPLENHHGGTHDQVNLWKEGSSGSDAGFRFFED